MQGEKRIFPTNFLDFACENFYVHNIHLATPTATQLIKWCTKYTTMGFIFFLFE